MSTQRGTIKEYRFKSEELSEEIELLVYLPFNFSPLYKYTLVIAQDGRDYFQMGKIGRVADELLSNDEIEQIIIVGIPYQDRFDRRRKYHPDGEQHEAYVRFLAHELVPFLDEEFPTYQMGYGRALIGDSLGGTVSLLTALKYPHTFGKVIMQSPLVDETVMKAVQNFEEPHLLELYHVIGTEETDVPTTDGKRANFIEPNRELHQLLNKKGFPYFYEEFKGTHTWKYWQADLKRALLEMF
ncbi:alpha/beta hydrolase [Peribacillus asahii]|uniref:alpha/beta hydrolase n=1 Tax=Peribacillus asahii TaxID=228899 RepID=UPI00207AFF79|nr:alpha/beta hydrolase-fold protein [Peribacillus asahii]USK60848.1 esterase family protein [Peribacillus asahii]